jgi:integrase
LRRAISFAQRGYEAGPVLQNETLSSSAISFLLSSCFDALCLSDPRSHAPHAGGYALANAGHDTQRIQDWLGHRSIQHTTRYTLVAYAHAGATDRELMELSGHSEPRQLRQYLQEVDQEKMADSAVDKLLKSGAPTRKGRTQTPTYKPNCPRLQPGR